MEKIVVLLIGSQGSGKSGYCRDYLPGYLRISQDEQGRHQHFTLFEQAAAEGVPCIVIDRVNGIKSQRKRYLDVARQHGYHTRIVWLNVDRQLCLKRCLERREHPTLRPEAAEQALRIYHNHASRRCGLPPNSAQGGTWQVRSPRHQGSPMASQPRTSARSSLRCPPAVLCAGNTP